MNYNLMRSIDAVVGVFVCSFITVFDKLLSLFWKKQGKPDKINKIVVMKFWGMGSIIMASPALRALRDGYKDARITFLTLSRNREICQLLNLFEEVVTVRLDNGIMIFLKDLLSVLVCLRKERFDLLLDFEFFTRFSSILTYLVNAKVSVGFNTWEVWRGNFHTVKVPFNRYWHLTDNFNNMLSLIGVRVNSNDLPPLALSDDDRKIVERLLSEKWRSYERLIAVNVNNDPMAYERRWPKKNYQEIINKLIEKHGAKIVMIGSSKEAGYVADIAAGIVKKENLLNLAGKTSLGQLACLFEKAMFLLTNDSGPMHLAVAVKLRTVSFFGPETPSLCGPLGKGDIVFFKNIDCSPCMNVHSSKRIICSKQSAECMDKITVEDVLKKIEETYFKV
ncbi:MAG: glycosyltransferase family 9 protein [Elusimicrobia bacterium]|nr:glycosyltransferase family 9 protein [Candidatus Liberimonas magnetica]